MRLCANEHNAQIQIDALCASADDLKQEAAQPLQSLYKSHPEAQKLATTAKAVLVFPRIVKAGFVFGGSYGEDDAYAYIFDQQGLMASLSIEGTKVSPIKKP